MLNEKNFWPILQFWISRIFLRILAVLGNKVQILGIIEMVERKKFLANFTILYQENISRQEVVREIIPRILAILGIYKSNF